MKLTEWLVLYVRHKDMLDKKLVDHKEDGNMITFTYKDRNVVGIVQEQLEVVEIKGESVIATLHTKENVEYLANHWEQFTKHNDLTIIFAHPGRNEKLVIKPKTHATISENVVQGLWSLSQGVSYV
ncbi:MAG: hypothetical protein OXR66_09210 [Candidatus Woesearchaeota archaeon]|nr:hypothetical protein [Candidatus Woesearchaeota archaeon]